MTRVLTSNPTDNSAVATPDTESNIVEALDTLELYARVRDDADDLSGIDNQLGYYAHLEPRGQTRRKVNPDAHADAEERVAFVRAALVKRIAIVRNMHVKRSHALLEGLHTIAAHAGKMSDHHRCPDAECSVQVSEPIERLRALIRILTKEGPMA